MALRRGSLLGGLLMGAAGGLKGYAQQEEMRKAEAERERERKRQETLDRIRLIEAGATELPESGKVTMAMPFGGTMTAPVTPSPERGGTVTVGDRRFVVPTAMERTRQQVQFERGLREEDRESNNARAYETLRTAFPESAAAKRPYSPVMLYDKEYARLSGERQAQAQRAQVGQARADTQEARRRQAEALWNQVTRVDDQTKRTPEEQAFAVQTAQMFNRMRTANPRMDARDIMVAIFDAMGTTAKQEYTEAGTADREAQAAKLAADLERTRQRTLGGVVPNTGPMSQAPGGRPGMPSRPGAAPAQQIPVPLPGETRQQYWDRLKEQGIDGQTARQAAMNNIKG